MRTVIFDIDGTLIDSMSIDTELYFGSIREVLGPVRFRDLHDYDHVTDTGILLQVLDDNGCNRGAEVVAAIKSVFVGSMRRHVEDVGPFPTIDGAVQFLDRTRRSAEYNVAIATGGWRDSALLKLESAGFDVAGLPVVTSDDAPSRTGIMRLALERAGNGDGSVTYFGDAEWDRRACLELGWNFAAVGRDLDGIESYADIVF